MLTFHYAQSQEGPLKQIIWANEFSDEYLWEHTTAQEFIRTVLDPEFVEQWDQSGGVLTLCDYPNPIPRFHRIEITASHHSPQWMTWLALRR